MERKIVINFLFILLSVNFNESKFITNKAFEIMEHFWRLGWPGFANFGPGKFPHLKGVHINHHAWKERGNMIPFGLPIEGILERSNHPFHEIVKRIQPFSPVTTHLVGNPPIASSNLNEINRNSNPNHHLTNPGQLINQPPPIDGTIAGTINKITAEAVFGAEAHPTEDPMFPSPYDNSPAGPPTKEELDQAIHHHFTHNRLYHNQRTPSMYTPNEMFQGSLEFKPLGKYSGGKHTWDSDIFDRHFDSTFDITKLSNPLDVHSSNAFFEIDELMNRDNLITGLSSVIPSKIHAKHVPSEVIPDFDTNLDYDIDRLAANSHDIDNDDTMNHINHLEEVHQPMESLKSLTVVEDKHPKVNQELSFLDELALIVANEPHVRK